MQEKITRRTFLKRFSKYTVIAALSLFSGHYYSKEIEPNWIETTHLTITNPLLGESFNDFKIIQFSDTHLGFQFDLADLKKIIQKIMAEKPDLIIFSGDLVDNLLSFIEIDEVIIMLSSLSAPFGKFAVYGNHDHGGWGSKKYQYIMESAGFTLLKNEAVIIQNNRNEKFVLAGIDDAMLGEPDLHITLQDLPEHLFTLLISHAPDLADEVKKYPVHFQISGHSHGGQVQIPLYGPLITPPYGRNYYEGLYHISEQLSLYVNRGLGTTRLPYRFFSRPELTIYQLKSEK